MCKFKIYSYVCVCPVALSTEEEWGQRLPIIISTPHPQIMASKYQFSPKGGKMADCRAEARKIQDELKNYMCLKAKKNLKNDGNISKGHRSQHEGAPQGPIWDNLRFKRNNK